MAVGLDAGQREDVEARRLSRPMFTMPSTPRPFDRNDDDLVHRMQIPADL